jgi:hemerythrin superfamily protein
MFGVTKSGQPPDAVELLMQDHKDVDALFKEYESLQEQGSGAAREELVGLICQALSVHAKIEEELFYPAARGARGVESGLLDEAAVEHQSLKDIIGRLLKAPASDPLYDAGVKVLAEYTKHHVKEEESELFPEVRKSGIDLVALGAALIARKEVLMSRSDASSQTGDGANAKVRKSVKAKSNGRAHAAT